MIIKVVQPIGAKDKIEGTRINDVFSAGVFALAPEGDLTKDAIIETDVVMYTEDGNGDRIYYYDKETKDFLKGDLSGIEFPTHVLIAKEVAKKINNSNKNLYANFEGKVKDVHITDIYYHFVPSSSKTANFKHITFIKLRHSDELEKHLNELYGSFKFNVLKIIRSLEVGVEHAVEDIETINGVDMGLFNIINYDTYMFRNIVLSKITMDWLYTP